MSWLGFIYDLLVQKIVQNMPRKMSSKELSRESRELLRISENTYSKKCWYNRSFSEALILVTTNPQNIVHWFTSSFVKTKRSDYVVYIFCFVFVLTFKTIYVHNIVWPCSFHVRTGKSMNNILSHRGFVVARISASKKDLPVPNYLAFFNFFLISLE